MQRYETVERARAGDGSEFVLRRRGDEWIVFANERILMSSRMHHSEEALAKQALQRVSNAQSVFIGGLGLGYTARAALDAVSETARVVIAELVPALVGWNRSHLAHLAQRPLDDERCSVVEGDALGVLGAHKSTFDALLLDVDNGPVALSQANNQRLYTNAGIRTCLAALHPGGVLAVWSAGPSEDYERRLRAQARGVEVLSVAARAGSRTKHYMFIARR